jgi:hypothetical protein
MFTLTSTATKIAIIALSAGLCWSAFDAVTLGFQTSAHATPTIELPQVVVIGYRASVSPDTMQAAAKVISPSPI